MTPTRVRFAPSPTGNLHLGGARTALLNFLFAKHCDGKLIVRIEDTDLKRNQEDAEALCLKWIKWLGIEIDETVDTKDQSKGPYRQSERLEIYKKYAHQLIEQDGAFPCFCSKEKLDEERKKQLAKGVLAPRYQRNCLKIKKQDQEKLMREKDFCIRLKVNNDIKVSFQDLVYGKISFDSKEIEDFIILRSNGMPNYNFAVVIDDHLMEISHVLRGSDHISNTPKQILVYQALSWEPPLFGHLTLIKMGAKKMSKREFVAEHYLEFYEKEGFLPEAISNYLSLLGWQPKVQEEIFSMKDLCRLFDGKELNKNESSFDLSKLIWFNQKHLHRLDDSEFQRRAQKFIEKFASERGISFEEALRLTLAIRNEISFFGEIKSLVSLFFHRDQNINQEEKKELSPLKLFFEFFLFLLKRDFDWTVKKLYQAILTAQEKFKLSKKKAIRAIFFLLTGRKKGLNPVNFIFFLGLEKTKNRLLSQIKEL